MFVFTGVDAGEFRLHSDEPGAKGEFDQVSGNVLEAVLDGGDVTIIVLVLCEMLVVVIDP